MKESRGVPIVLALLLVASLATAWFWFGGAEPEPQTAAREQTVRESDHDAELATGDHFAERSLVETPPDKVEITPNKRTLGKAGKGLGKAKEPPDLILRGHVVDENGTGIAGAEVRGYTPPQPAFESEANGWFEVRVDSRFDEFYVEASADGFVAAGQLVAAEDREAGIQIVLGRGATVRGIVYGPGQKPVAGADVVLRTNKTKTRHRVETITDRSGRFELTGLPSGAFPLLAAHADFAAARRTIEVPAHGQVVDVVLELSPGRALRGMVKSSDGRPIAEAEVEIYGDGKTSFRRGETDDDGSFELDGLPVTDLRLGCRATGFVPQWLQVDATTTYREIQLEPTARVAGTVFDARTGEPVTSFRIRMFEDRGAAEGKRGKDALVGHFKVDDPNGHWDSGGIELRPGQKVRIDVEAAGYLDTAARGLVASHDASPVDHRTAMSAGVRLHGTVLDRNGAPVAKASLRIPGQRQWSDARGRFAFDGAPSGQLHIAIERGTDAVFVHTAAIPADANDWQITIRLAEQGALRGLAYEPDGSLAPGAEVALRPIEVPGLGRRTRRTTADGAGRFAFADLPFGLYRLARLLPEGKQQEMFGINVQIVDATPLELELLPLGVGTVSGTLTCAVEIPEGTTVMLEPVYDDNVPPAVRGSTRHARSRGGAFVFEGVEPGRYALRAHFYDAATGAWIYGRTPAEVQDGGESRLELALDQRK